MGLEPHCAWIVHVLCLCDIHNVVKSVGVLNEYICSDHRLLSLSVELSLTSSQKQSNGNVNKDNFEYVDWAHASNSDIQRYNVVLDCKLAQLSIPYNLTNSGDFNQIDNYLNSVVGLYNLHCTIHLVL